MTSHPATHRGGGNGPEHCRPNRSGPLRVSQEQLAIFRLNRDELADGVLEPCS